MFSLLKMDIGCSAGQGLRLWCDIRLTLSRFHGVGNRGNSVRVCPNESSAKTEFLVNMNWNPRRGSALKTRFLIFALESKISVYLRKSASSFFHCQTEQHKISEKRPPGN